MVQSITSVEEFKQIVRAQPECRRAPPPSHFLFTTLRAQIQSAERAVVVDFWATWCGPCKLIGPVFEKLSGQFPGADYYKVDIDQCADIAQEVGVRSVRAWSPSLPLPPLDFVFRLCSWGRDAYACWGQMPTFIAFKGGERVKEVSGANPGALQVEIDSFEFVLRCEMADQRRCRL